MAFIVKDRHDILFQALRKIEKNTDLTATGPGSIARALTEAVTTELADFYDILDFNMSLQLISTAQGRALDLMGTLYNVERKTLSSLATIDKQLGSFYFYLNSPAITDITIPAGTQIVTDNETYIGERYVYQTSEATTIPAGRLKAWASIRPLYSDSVFVAGIGTLTNHNYEGAPVGIIINCINPKAISPQVSYEDDDAYRTRITKAVRTAAGGTAEAVRFAGLAVPGVRDITIRNAAFGLGSFEVLVALDTGSINQYVMSDVRTETDRVRPVGTRMILREPELLPIDVKASILLKNENVQDQQAISRRAKVAILRYLNTMLIGTTLIYSRLLQYVLESSESILDVSLVEYQANGEELLRRNLIPLQDQQIIPGNIEVAYSV